MEVHCICCYVVLHLEVHPHLSLHGTSFGSPLTLVMTRCLTWESTTIVVTFASPESPPWLSMSHLSLLVLHLKVHLGSLWAICRYWCFTWNSTIVLGACTSLRSTHPRLSTSHILHCRRKNLAWKCFIWKHSTSYELCTLHSRSRAFMALLEPFVEVVERTHHSIIAYNNI